MSHNPKHIGSFPYINKPVDTYVITYATKERALNRLREGNVAQWPLDVAMSKATHLIRSKEATRVSVWRAGELGRKKVAMVDLNGL